MALQPEPGSTGARPPPAPASPLALVAPPPSHPAGAAGAGALAGCAAEAPAAATAELCANWRCRWPAGRRRQGEPRPGLAPSELQDFRGSMRDALARTPPSAPAPERPPPAESRKKARGTGARSAGRRQPPRHPQFYKRIKPIYERARK